jgi:DNA polymerase-3 subunit beta
MRIICSKENLVEGIGIVQKAVSSKSTLPILEGILLEAYEDKFKLTGNDLEIGIECYVEADIQQAGSVVLNSKTFGDIVRRLPDSEVLIEVTSDNLVVIECDNSHFEIKGLSAYGFPALPAIKQENSFMISQKLLRDMIRQTIFAISLDENRPILTGSLIECNDGIVTIVSMDVFRLALRKSTLNNKVNDFSVVVPGKTLNEISKILQPVDDEVTIYSSSNQILFDMGNCKIVSRLLEGKYLNYNSIIRHDSETKVRVNVKSLLSSIERASLVASADNKHPVKFDIRDDKIIITSNTEIGTAREEISVETVGKELQIGFNPRYLIDALKAIDDEEVEVTFITNLLPCTIKPVDGDEFIYVIGAVKI